MIRLAVKVASESKFKRARVGAVIVKSGRVLATGYNRIGFTKYLPDRPYPESIHAEQQAILELLKKHRLADLAGSVMFVTRVTKAGQVRLAKPCQTCLRLIQACNIKKVVYTTNNGMEVLKL